MLKVITCSQKVILDMGKRCSIVFFVIFLVTASILSTVECNASGPPAGACTTLSPLQSAHLNAPAQTTPVPYDVDLSALAGDNGTFSYKPGMTYRLTVSGVNNEQFRGVLLQGRLAADDTTPAGTFAVTDPLTRLSSCTPPAIGVSHNSGVDKSSISTMWTAPPKGTGTVRIGFAVVQVRQTYWANQRTADIAENGGSGQGSFLSITLLINLALLGLFQA